MITPEPRRSLHEAAHKLDPETSNGNGTAGSGVRRSFNEAAHKLGYWPVSPAPPSRVNGFQVATDVDDGRDIVAHASRMVLALGALGVVYGDIGTSPLYAERVIFTAHAD